MDREIREEEVISEGERRSFTHDEGERAIRIMNPNRVEAYRLGEDEEYRLVFHPGNVRSLTKPKKQNGDPLCIRFHNLAFCFKDCKLSGSHVNLTQEEAKTMAEYVDSARKVRKSFRSRQAQGRGGGSNIKDSEENKNEKQKREKGMS